MQLTLAGMEDVQQVPTRRPRPTRTRTPTTERKTTERGSDDKREDLMNRLKNRRATRGRTVTDKDE